mmetsp:Transcript_106598/g.217452  ORF Transcript_106598/g.217452 Transcript_106598/m.217452 type:complete len:568 (+) Transcript_106598:81-1784(+)
MAFTGASARGIAALVLFHVMFLCGASLRGAVVADGEAFSDRTVVTQELEANLQTSLEASMRGGDGMISQRIAKIEASMWQTFQALPKNAMGRLAPRGVRYMVHNYFAKEHGWLIKGLEPHGMQSNVSEVHEVSILQDKAPALVEALLEARQSGRGLSLGDAVVMIAVLERLIIKESITLLEASYTLNGQSSTEQLTEADLHEVLTSYLLVFEMGMKGNLSDTRKHQAMKKSISQKGQTWQTLVEFEQDAVFNFGYEHRARLNPFTPPQYSFQAASQIVEDLAHDYGKWQNTECRQMKEDLMELSPRGDGRVPLKNFYSQPEGADYQFTESVEYLRKIGALDETSSGGPKVLIANYVAGPSNCIASSTYYSVCCLSECEGVMSELESKIHAPAASPERLLGVVSNLSSTDTPMRNPDILAEKLSAIAEQNNGDVPLHGRLFAQWLHHAFPNECPYPQIAESAEVLTPSHWMDKKATAPKAERKLHAETSDDTVAGAEPAVLQWSDEEVLPLLERQHGRSAFGNIVRIAVQLAMFCVLIRIAFTGWHSVASASGGDKKEKKGFQLPLHM